MKLPAGYSNLFPYLVVNNPGPYIQFLEKAFGAKIHGRTAMEGRLANARIDIGGTGFMLSEATENISATRTDLYLYVEDADAVFDEAVRQGAKSLFVPYDTDYGDRQGGVEDAEGNKWWISTRLVDEPYDH